MSLIEQLPSILYLISTTLLPPRKSTILLMNLNVAKIYFSLSVSATILMSYGIVKCFPMRYAVVSHRDHFIPGNSKEIVFLFS